MTTVTLHTDNKDKISALKALMKAWKIQYEITESPYDPDFVEKIKQSEKQLKEGKSTRVKGTEINKFLGL